MKRKMRTIRLLISKYFFPGTTSKDTSKYTIINKKFSIVYMFSFFSLFSSEFNFQTSFLGHHPPNHPLPLFSQLSNATNHYNVFPFTYILFSFQSPFLDSFVFVNFSYKLYSLFSLFNSFSFTSFFLKYSKK